MTPSFRLSGHPVATDFVQVVREAVATILETDAELVAITGRTYGNIIAFNSDVDPETPVLAYEVIAASEDGGVKDTRLVRTQFSALADEESTVHEMLGVVERKLSANAFSALAVPLDAVPIRRLRSGVDLEVFLRVTRTAPAIA